MKTVEFWSSVEYGTFLRGLVRELNDAGWDARQRYLIDEKEYRRQRKPHSTAWLRLRTYLFYPLHVYRRIRQSRNPAVLVVCTNTFYAPAVAILAARKHGVPVVHWVFDLYPDVLVQLGRMRSDGIVERALAQFTRYALRHAAANVFLGEDVRQRAEERFGDVPRTAIIPVGADGAPFRSDIPRRVAANPIRVFYCGNVGRMHDVDTIIGLLRDGVPKGFSFQFRGKGIGLEQLYKAIAHKAGVTFGASLDQDEWWDAMRESDIALVTFKADARGLGMPSKAYSAMVAGQAILAICPFDSDLGRTIRDHDAGWVVEPGRVNDLRRLLQHIAENSDELAAKRRNAFRAGHEYYDQNVIAVRWSELLTGLIADRDSDDATEALVRQEVQDSKGDRVLMHPKD